MTGYLVPEKAAETEFTEKRSRFIGRVWPVGTEEEARALIEETRKHHRDARHNCWCYLLREGGILRASDDGEPQGTAGQPMLEVFRRAEVTNACCVVTRYFGGVLLGTGGLCRAYTRAARDTLAAAGVQEMRAWARLHLRFAYPLLQEVQRAIVDCGGAAEKTEYGEDVSLLARVPEECAAEFSARLTERCAGAVSVVPENP